MFDNIFGNKNKCNICDGTGKYTSIDGVPDTCYKCHGAGDIADRRVDHVHRTKLEELECTVSELKQERREIDRLLKQLVKNEESRILLYSIGQTSPIMQWAKNIHGVYTYMNQALCDHLYYGNPKELIGLNDLQIIEKHKLTYPNHNFGSICMGTDQMVIDADKPTRYNEWGIVRDKFQYVVAYKNTYKDEDGNILGSCGLAVYVTEEVEEIISIMNGTSDESTKARLGKYLARYGFGQDNTFSDINIQELWKIGGNDGSR